VTEVLHASSLSKRKIKENQYKLREIKNYLWLFICRQTDRENKLKIETVLEDCYSTRVWTDFGLGLGLGP